MQRSFPTNSNSASARLRSSSPQSQHYTAKRGDQQLLSTPTERHFDSSRTTQRLIIILALHFKRRRSNSCYRRLQNGTSAQAELREAYYNLGITLKQQGNLIAAIEAKAAFNSNLTTRKPISTSTMPSRRKEAKGSYKLL